MTAGVDDGETYFGIDAVLRGSVLNTSHPIERGVVSNWDDLEQLYKHIFENELRVEPSEQYLLLADSLRSPQPNREKLVTVAFESLNVPGTYIGLDSVMAFYASGRTTGTVLNSGDGVTSSVPVYEGFAQTKAMGTLDVAGNDLTRYMSDRLLSSGCDLSSFAGLQVAGDMKEKVCFVCSNLVDELGSDHTMDYQLPDGQTISVNKQRYEVPEALFDPRRLSNEGMGIHRLVYDSIMCSDPDTRVALFNNVVLVRHLCYSISSKTD